MKEQEYKIENIKSFELADIFDCGQCFRWNKQEDGSYTGIFRKNVMNVQRQGNTVTFKGKCDGDIKEIVENKNVFFFLAYNKLGDFIDC